MTRDEFKILVKGLKAVYTQPSFIPDKDAFEVWYSMLGDLDYEVCSNAIKIHMQTVEKEPAIAGIRKQAACMRTNKNELNEMAAWQMVLKAMRNSIYHAQEEFVKLPPVVQRAVVSPGQLREWAMAEDIDGTWMNVTQSNFLRTYRAEVAKEKELHKLSPDLLKLVSRTPPVLVNQVEHKELSAGAEREPAERDAAPMPELVREKYMSLLDEAVS